MSSVMSNGNVDFETSIYECSESAKLLYFDDCYGAEIILNVENIELSGNVNFTDNTRYPQISNYQLKGWVKLNKLEGIELVTTFIRMTINFDYSDDLFIGD